MKTQGNYYCFEIDNHSYVNLKKIPTAVERSLSAKTDFRNPHMRELNGIIYSTSVFIY